MADAETADTGPTGSNRLARHSLLYTVGVVVQGVSTLAVLPFATRLLGSVEYGHLAVGLAIIQMGAVIAVAGLPIAITRAYFDPGGLRRARAMMGLVVGIGLTAAVVALLLRPLVGGVIALAVSAVGAMTLVVAGQALLRAQGRPLLFVLTSVGSTAGAHVVGLGSATLTPTAEAYLVGYLAGAALTAVLAMAITPPLAPWQVSGATGEGMRIALPVLPHTAAILILNAADPLLVSRVLGPGEAGRYQVAMMLGLAPLVVLAGINNAWSPAIMGAREDDRWPFLARSVRPILWIAAVCTLGVALLAPLAARVLAPADFGYAELTRMAQLIALCALAQVVYLAAASVIFNQKRTTPLAVSTPLAAAFFVAVSIPLMVELGVLGMAIAKVAGFVVLALATSVVAGRAAHVPWEAHRWAPMIGVALGGVLLLQFVPDTAVAIAVQAGGAAVLGVVALGRIAHTALPGRANAAP